MLGKLLDKLLGKKDSVINADPRTIPVPASMYGPGPEYVSTAPKGYAATYPGNPYATTVGSDLPTLADQRSIARYGQMRFYDETETENLQRHSVETLQTRDFSNNTEKYGGVVQPTRPAPERWTAYTHPNLYSFVRPFNSHAARELNGYHFSMADHRRTYDVMTMKPVRQIRNTYRTEPGQWDANIVDKVEGDNTTTVTGYDNTSAPDEVGSRASFRL